MDEVSNKNKRKAGGVRNVHAPTAFRLVNVSTILYRSEPDSTSAASKMLLTACHRFLLHTLMRTPSRMAQGRLFLTRVRQRLPLHSVRLLYPSQTRASEPPPASLHLLPARYRSHAAE